MRNNMLLPWRMFPLLCVTSCRLLGYRVRFLNDGNMALKSPAAERNKEPILQVLKEVLKEEDGPQTVLEVAAG